MFSQLLDPREPTSPVYSSHMRMPNAYTSLYLLSPSPLKHSGASQHTACRRGRPASFRNVHCNAKEHTQHELPNVINCPLVACIVSSYRPDGCACCAATSMP